MKGPIFSIGYGNRNIEDFLNLLSRFEIQILIDTRSSPYSRFRPDYRKQALQAHLTQAGIQYLFMGDTLGGRPSDPACYTDGKVDYHKLKQQPFYQAGIHHLRQMWAEGIRLCLMCAEAKPQECHRSRLLGETLAATGIEVVHIDEAGLPQTHIQVIARMDGQEQPRLFE